MLKASVKISPVLGNAKLQHIPKRSFHLPTTSKITTFAKSTVNLQQTITLKQKFNNKNNNNRWSSSSNTQTESGLEHKPVKQYTRFTPSDVPPEEYATYITTDGLVGGIVSSAAAALAMGLLFMYLQSEATEIRDKKIAAIEGVPSVAELSDKQADDLVQGLSFMKTVSAEHQAKFINFLMEVLQTHSDPKVVEHVVKSLRRLLTGPPIAIPTPEIIQKITTDALIQEIPIQKAFVSFLSEAALKPSSRAQIANPLVVDYAELLTNHSEESVATQATHVLLSLARSRDHVEMLGGTVHTLWNIIFRNEHDEAVGYAKEALSLITSKRATSNNEEFKQIVDNQIKQANIHPKALESISGYRNTHLLTGLIGANVATALTAAGWSLVRWHTQLAKSAHHIDTPTARKIVSMKIIPTVAASVALLNFVLMTGVGTVYKPDANPELPVVVFTAGLTSNLVPFSFAPALVGFYWTRFLTRNNFVRDVDYQY